MDPPTYTLPEGPQNDCKMSRPVIPARTTVGPLTAMHRESFASTWERMSRAQWAPYDEKTSTWGWLELGQAISRQRGSCKRTIH